jgi:hypothetical protein
MFSRFRDSLITPQAIVSYKNDSLKRIWTYILMFSLLMTSGTLVSVIQTDSERLLSLSQFEDHLLFPETDCVLDNYTVICDSKQTHLLYSDTMVDVFISNQSIEEINFDSSPQTILIIMNDELLISSMGFGTTPFPLEQIHEAFESFDFSTASNNPNDYETFFLTIIGDLIDTTKWIWASSIVLIEFSFNILFSLLIVWINVRLIKYRLPIFNSKERFRIAVYISTGLWTVFIFTNLINIGFFLSLLIIGYLSYRQMNLITKHIMTQGSDSDDL